MFDTYSEANMVTHEDLAVRYTATPYTFITTTTTPEGEEMPILRTQWDVRRVATKRYSFVGMTREAAQKCARDKVAMYTRPYFVVSGGEAVVLFSDYNMTDISVVHDEGHMYRVDINVNETETIRVFTLPAKLESLFPIRDYDGGDGGGDEGDEPKIEIVQVAVYNGRLSIRYKTSNVDGFMPSLCQVWMRNRHEPLYGSDQNTKNAWLKVCNLTDQMYFDNNWHLDEAEVQLQYNYEGKWLESNAVWFVPDMGFYPKEVA